MALNKINNINTTKFVQLVCMSVRGCNVPAKSICASSVRGRWLRRSGSNRDQVEGAARVKNELSERKNFMCRYTKTRVGVGICMSQEWKRKLEK